MERFTVNGWLWRIRFVDPDSPYLVDRTGRRTIAVTDPKLQHVFVARGLSGEKLRRVLIHELGHVTLVSYGLLPELHRMVRPAYWTEAEEWICNLLADYGAMIFRKASDQLGYDILEWQPPYARDGIA